MTYMQDLNINIYAIQHCNPAKNHETSEIMG